MRKTAALILLFCYLFLLPSCGEISESASSLLCVFAEAYGADGIIYSPDVAEGEAGYVDSNFFRVLFGGEADFESDYAVFLSASLEAVYEAGVFVCRDDTSLLYAEELLRDRISLLSKMGYAGSPILIRRGDTVFYSTLPDARRAEDIWRDIKI